MLGSCSGHGDESHTGLLSRAPARGAEQGLDWPVGGPLQTWRCWSSSKRHLSGLRADCGRLMNLGQARQGRPLGGGAAGRRGGRAEVGAAAGVG